MQPGCAVCMEKKTTSDWKGFWALLWRSLVFFPYMLAVFIGVGSIWLSRFVLPLCGAAFLYLQDWWNAGIALALWLLAIWSYRRFRLARFYEAPSSFL